MATLRFSLSVAKKLLACYWGASKTAHENYNSHENYDFRVSPVSTPPRSPKVANDRENDRLLHLVIIERQMLHSQTTAKLQTIASQQP